DCRQVGRTLDFDDQEDLYFHSKRLCIYTKLRSNIFENFKIVYRGKVCWIRAKEVPGWVPEFLDDSDDESQSEEGIDDHEHLGHDEHSCGEDNDVNEVGGMFDESSGQKKNHLEDPFGFYSLLNKNKDDTYVNGTEDEQSIKYPSGFTPEAENREFNLSEENVRSTNVENLKQGNDVEILDEQKDIHDVKGSKTQDSVSALIPWETREGSCVCGIRIPFVKNDSRDKRMLWDYLTHVSSQWDGEVVMMGDFNEVPLGGSAFTWSHKSATKMSKIDRFLISDGLMNTCPNINAITLERYLSDHRPILFRESTYDYGPIPFRFYHHWLALDGFDNFVIDIWRNTPGDKSNAMRNLMYKLKFLKVRIRGWLSTNRNSTKAEITRLIGELAKLDEVIDNAFRDRFDEPKDDRVCIDMCFPRSLSNEQKDDLERMVSMEEVKRAVWDCGTDKSPGPDGFSFGFYRHFWPTIDNEYLRQPISLIGSIYKIVAKILANRIVGVLDDIVNEVQSAFIAERQILDGPKAYDTVRWDFLDDVLHKFGFGNKWRLWIQSCLRSSRGSIIVNGSPTEEFQFFKGLKQGDPLSPFLFILIMESLHLSFQRVVDAGMYTGIKLCSSLNLSHLFYADDVMFVGQWCDSNINTLVHALECFHRASGLKINMSKSKILGIHVEDVKVRKSEVLCRGYCWDEVVEKVTSRLSRWKMKTLSIGGRLTLLKSVLGSMPIFHMSIFKVPSSVLQRLESIRSRFFKGHDLGSNKASWVKWSNVLTSKEKGGLGVSSLYALNRGLLFKWVVEFYAQKTSLWARVIKAIHGVDGNFIGYGEYDTFWEDRWLEGLDSSFRRKARGGIEQVQYEELSDMVNSISLTLKNDRWFVRFLLGGI
ncbi:RNA-directed DNA polymerase, eukaryota, partial [Tanacetum coccineum]